MSFYSLSRDALPEMSSCTQLNLYVHFPFCRSKCAYCALRSRGGASVAERAAYAARLVNELERVAFGDGRDPDGTSPTVYFGGGTPALCDLRPVCAAVRKRFGAIGEFTVELNPSDVTPALLADLRAGGVNRISMGVQSLDDVALRAMGRPHTADEAEAAFRAIRAAGFGNAGFDLIAGWPGTTAESWGQTLARACALRPDHVSVYTLIREPETALDRAVRAGRVSLPDDEAALAQHDAARAALASIGLARYEVSNFAKPGFECRHNMSVWRGEDYVGLGEGAHGREGVRRTVGNGAGGYDVTVLTPEADALERALFALRMAEGIDLAWTERRWPVLGARRAAWRDELQALVPHGIVRTDGRDRFALTDRGFEVCDAVISAIMSAGQETAA